MAHFKNAESGSLVAEIAAVIVENKAYLSEIDGLIGDGDHGVNMAKGFSRTAERLTGDESLSEALGLLSDVLMSEIGGSMGPLYGMMFSGMAEAIEGKETITADDFAALLENGLQEVMDIGSAKVGDKTLLDAYCPSVEAYKTTLSKTQDMTEALDALCEAAQKGRDSTVDLVAKVGRSSVWASALAGCWMRVRLHAVSFSAPLPRG